MSEQKHWQLRPEHSGCLLRLQKILERVRGFRVLILQHNRPKYRDGIIAFLREAEPDSALLDLKESGSFAAFEAELGKYSLIRQLHLINLEALPRAEQQAFFKGLNYHREHLARTCSGILLFWLPDHLINQLAVEAPDFWAWREQVLDFSVPVEPVERMTVDWVKSWNLELSGKQERIKEIEDFLARPAEEPSLTAADLKRELGNLYESIGEYTEAKKILEAAVDEYGQLDEAQARASARRDLAELLATQGDPDQALIMLREQVLPVFRQLNNVQEEAETKDRIADIFERRGELDAALRIREQEILPFVERLGDLRNKAVTMGKIADILETRGQLDDALKIREQEELTIYDRIGDVRELLLCRTKIALLLHEMDAETNQERIEKLLRLALADARRLKLPRETAWIEGIIRKTK
ncbi:MAG: tetratricopeptide repeat protein [Candidatus Electrothrix sp. YB6]